MGFRFRKRIKLAPGVHLNLSKGGISTSIGGNGLTANFRNGKQKTTVGIPGTGLSFESKPTDFDGGLALVVGLVFAILAFWLI